LLSWQEENKGTLIFSVAKIIYTLLSGNQPKNGLIR
jgi:hypothetical protein